MNADALRALAALEAGADLTIEERAAATAALRQAVTLPQSATEERDRLLRQCRQRFFPNHSVRDAADQLAIEWRRYASAGWRRGDRSCQSCPASIVGKLQGDLWRIMRIWSRSTLTPERIRKILGHVQ